MDPDNLVHFIDLEDENKSDAVVVDETLEEQHSGCESTFELRLSESESEEAHRSTSEDDIEDGRSVHIIFVRDENASSAQTLPSKSSIMNGSVKTFSDMKSVTIDASSPEGEGPGTPCGVVTCSNEDSGSECEVVYVSDRNSDAEVEEDFDTSTEFMIQVDQESPPLGTPRKRKKRKICKVCGMSVERKDLLSHVREHRLRKLKFAQNKSSDASGKPLELPRKPLSPTEKASLQSNSVRTVSSMEGEKKFPLSCVQDSSSDRPFKCNICGETFRTQSGLTIHFKSHSGECSNTCPVS